MTVLLEIAYWFTALVFIVLLGVIALGPLWMDRH